MKTPVEFLKTIYLGDRVCKSILIDGSQHQLVLRVDCISRIRDPSGRWNFYRDENIEDGLIVFTDVSSFKISPLGVIPNDAINELVVDETKVASEQDIMAWTFRLSIDSITSDSTNVEAVLEIVSSGIHIEDPCRPGVWITE
ncbi:MAG TPA: DUF6258 family protein [Thermoguttaceae bacterium]|nr:DUF6258 family protein [Thermoguttaceae bacterium]